MSNRTTRVTLTAQATGYISAFAAAEKQTRATAAASEDAKRKFEEQNQAMESTGRGMLAMGAVVMAVTALSVKAAIDWESAWAGVTKTVDGTTSELAAVEAGLRSLTGILPASHQEIAAVAEAAGQLGVQTSSVVAFTRTMIDLGETTNLSSQEAATQLARFMNVMGTSQEQVSNLGSAVVELGNNYATTEAEIVDMSMRLSGAAKVVGLTEGQTLGLATALSSVGIEAEAGGSAVSKVMIEIASQVASGGDKLEKFSRTAGMSASDFAAKWKTAPGEALAAFVRGLANAEAQGSSTLEVLADLGITEIRMRDALLRSAAASDSFTEAMETGNDAFAENNALQAEAAKRYATTESRIKMASNAVVDAAIDYGKVFLPAVNAAADGVKALADLFGAMPPSVQGFIAITTTAAGAILLGAGAFLVAVPAAARYKVALDILATSSMPAVANAATWMMASTTKAAAAMTAAGRFLAGPWGIALVAAAVGVKVLIDVLDQLKSTSAEITNSLTTAGSAAEIFAVLGKGREATAWRDVVADLNDMSRMLDLVDEQNKNVWARFNSEPFGFIQAVEDIGKELGALASTDLPAAQRAFSLMTEEQDLSEAQMLVLLDTMPAYRDALIQQATALGIQVEGLSDSERAQRLLQLAQGTGIGVTQGAADAYLQAADEAAGLEDQLRKLLDVINAANGVGQDAVTTNARFQQALADVAAYVAEAQAGVEGYALGLDESTAAGAANAQMLSDLARQSQDAAAAQYALDGNTDAYLGRLQSGRQVIYDTALALTGNADAAQLLTDKIYAMPDSKAIQVLVDTSTAEYQISEFIAKPRSMAVSLMGFNPAETYGNETGGMWSKGVKEFATGGFESGIYAGGQNIHKFAETGLPWEAYISPKPGYERENIGYALESLNRLGFQMPQADAAPSGPMQITGTLDLGDGITGRIEGAIEAYDASQSQSTQMGSVRF